MMFIEDAENVARAAMIGISRDLTETYVGLIRFLSTEPDAALKIRGGTPEVGSAGYIQYHARGFAESRRPRAPAPPSTTPDEMVSLILNSYFDVPVENLDRAKNEHLLSMGAENLVGELLERYLASIMEPRGWIWCSGSMVKAVDFIKPPINRSANWSLLQVKNRDNSENSSSSAIRNGTSISKWFRTFSRKRATNWDAFPDEDVRRYVSEEGFNEYVRTYLHNLR